jgi:hypothetical protein
MDAAGVTPLPADSVAGCFQRCVVLWETKPTITPEQLGQPVDMISEPYSTMVYVCVLA